MVKLPTSPFITHFRPTARFAMTSKNPSPRASDAFPHTIKAEPRSPSPLRAVSPSETTSTPTDPRDIDYRAHPELYKILRGEMNVFKTQPYSDELKVLWRFKDEATARRSSGELYERFEGFR